MAMQEIIDKLKAGEILYALAPDLLEVWKFYIEGDEVKFDDGNGFKTQYPIELVLENNLWGYVLCNEQGYPIKE